MGLDWNGMEHENKMGKAMKLVSVVLIIVMALVVGTAALNARCDENPTCLTESDCSDDESSVCCKVGTCPPDNSRGWCTETFCLEDFHCGDGDNTYGYVCKEIGECGKWGYCELSDASASAPAPAPT